MDKEERARIIRESRANLARLNEQAERWRREETDEQRLARLDRRAAEAKPLTYKTLDNAQMEETHSHADGDNITRSWDDWLDARLNVRLHQLTEGIGEELGAMLDAEREKSRSELAPGS